MNEEVNDNKFRTMVDELIEAIEEMLAANEEAEELNFA